MIDLDPSSMDLFADSATEITTSISKNVPIIGNAALCMDSVCTTSRAGANFYYSPNPVAKAFFAVSCLCGVIGATASGASLATSVSSIPVAGWLGFFGARAFNRAGKYILHMGNVTSDNITNVTDISELMS